MQQPEKLPTTREELEAMREKIQQQYNACIAGFTPEELEYAQRGFPLPFERIPSQKAKQAAQMKMKIDMISAKLGEGREDKPASIARNAQEIKRLRDQLFDMTCFITDHGTTEEHDREEVSRANWAADTLDWVLGEVETEYFLGGDYLGTDRMEEIIKRIEKRTGTTLAEYVQGPECPEAPTQTP